ncbi:unnamed protein product, partial [Mesorhabditis belari]|uniref:Uncharacterized protein n=1 Tax=Mesorhabditis belari TaxID=2138241 RepID=A0AAF3FHS2_9BILA
MIAKSTVATKSSNEPLRENLKKIKETNTTFSNSFVQAKSKLSRDRSEPEIEYDQLSFAEKLALLVEDELVDPLLDSISDEIQRTKRAYNTEGFGAVLKVIFSAPVSAEQRERERREAETFGAEVDEVVDRTRRSISRDFEFGEPVDR